MDNDKFSENKCDYICRNIYPGLLYEEEVVNEGVLPVNDGEFRL